MLEELKELTGDLKNRGFLDKKFRLPTNERNPIFLDLRNGTRKDRALVLDTSPKKLDLTFTGGKWSIPAGPYSAAILAVRGRWKGIPYKYTPSEELIKLGPDEKYRNDRREYPKFNDIVIPNRDFFGYLVKNRASFVYSLEDGLYQSFPYNRLGLVGIQKLAQFIRIRVIGDIIGTPDSYRFEVRASFELSRKSRHNLDEVSKSPFNEKPNGKRTAQKTRTR